MTFYPVATCKFLNESYGESAKIEKPTFVLVRDDESYDGDNETLLSDKWQVPILMVMLMKKIAFLRMKSKKKSSIVLYTTMNSMIVRTMQTLQKLYNEGKNRIAALSDRG